MAADDYLAPSGTVSPRTPLFTWKRIPQAASYWVVIARDQAFTNVVSVSFTEFAAYSPADALQDETTSYYWVVLPAKNKDGSGVFTSVAANQPRAFEKRSVPPAALTPDDGADIPGSPRFAWSAAEGAAKYRLQVAADSSFGALIDDITTAATSYTATKTYPVDTVLYWRVRAVDGSGNGLTFSSPVRTFRRRLPMPALAPDNPLGGGAIPSLSWSPVQGAESYDVHVDQTDGRRLDFNVKSAQFTPTAFYGNGVWHWQVRAVFPGSPSSPGPYTPMVPFTRAITAPADAKAERSSGRILLSWAPLEGARRYKVEIADATGFARSIQSVTTDLTAWAPDLSRLGYQKGGTLYWRVAAVDEGNNTGAFSSGTITLDKRLVVTASGKPKRRLKTLITIRVSDAGNTDIKGAKVVLAGAGVKVTRKTPKSGSVSFQIKPRKKGTITIKATRKGYKSATTKLRVR
jgi:hypothetical protein